uniref:TNFAIP3 interacting protein 3 n=2 Tax=Salvator merianae TaxID=96440 RepID=A0A8D0CAG7_SALMN
MKNSNTVQSSPVLYIQEELEIFSCGVFYSQVLVEFLLQNVYGLFILKAFSEHRSTQGFSGQMQASMDDRKTPGSLSEHILTKTPKDTMEEQIILLEKQRQELLAVNKQWDQQFRRMKQKYENKVTEIKEKLEAMQKTVREMEKERQQMQQKSQKLEAQATDRLVQEMRDKNNLKEENRLLKEEIFLANKKKVHYKCEISRLNKAVLDAYKNQRISSCGPAMDSSDKNCNPEEMKIEIDILRQQVQIYEEDFKKERSDRERLNEEKEVLQRINESIQSQVNNLSAQIKGCQEEKKLLEKQLKQQAKDFQKLTEKHGSPHQMLVPPCFNHGNCSLFQ